MKEDLYRKLSIYATYLPEDERQSIEKSIGSKKMLQSSPHAENQSVKATMDPVTKLEHEKAEGQPDTINNVEELHSTKFVAAEVVVEFRDAVRDAEVGNTPFSMLIYFSSDFG